MNKYIEYNLTQRKVIFSSIEKYTSIKLSNDRIIIGIDSAEYFINFKTKELAKKVYNELREKKNKKENNK